MLLLTAVPQRARSTSETNESSSAIIQGGFSGFPKQYGIANQVEPEQFKNKRAFRLDLTKRKLTEISSVVPIHSLESPALNPAIAVGIPRKCDTVSLFDWSSRTEARTLKLPAGRLFYGHGAFTDDGKTILATVSHYENGETIDFIYHIDVASLKIEAQIRFPAGICHDLVSMGQEVFAIAGSSDDDIRKGGHAKLSLYNSRSKKFSVLESPPLKKFDSGVLTLRHILRTREQTLLVASARSDGHKLLEAGLIEFNVQKKSAKEVLPIGTKLFEQELLSFVESDHGKFVWVTMPDLNQILVWNFHEQKIACVLKFETSVRSIASFEPSGFIAVGTDSGFCAFDPRTFQRISSLESSWPKSSLDGLYCSHTRIV